MSPEDSRESQHTGKLCPTDPQHWCSYQNTRRPHWSPRDNSSTEHWWKYSAEPLCWEQTSASCRLWTQRGVMSSWKLLTIGFNLFFILTSCLLIKVLSLFKIPLFTGDMSGAIVLSRHWRGVCIYKHNPFIEGTDICCFVVHCLIPKIQNIISAFVQQRQVYIVQHPWCSGKIS